MIFHHVDRIVNRDGARFAFALSAPLVSHAQLQSILSVILNLLQDPFLTISGGLFGAMDPETSSG